MRKILLVLGLILFIVPAFAFAAEFKSSPEGNGTVVIGKNETPKNLYVAAGTVTVDGKTNGDLIAAGQTVNISGDVENNLEVAGNNLNLKGNIGKNARVLANTLNLDNKVGGDFMAGGKDINLSKGSEVDGDLVIAGNSVLLDGKVLGNVSGMGGTITINGEVTGNVTLKNINRLVVGNEAVINGKLIYSSPSEAQISSEAKLIGGTEFNKINNSKPHQFSTVALKFFYGILISLVGILLLILLFPKTVNQVANDAIHSSWAKIGWGFVVLLGTPILLIFLCLTMVGLKIALILGLLYALLLAVASLISPLLFGSAIFKVIGKKKVYEANWMSATLGVLALSVAGLIPLFGWIAVFLIFLLSLGQLITNCSNFVNAERK